MDHDPETCRAGDGCRPCLRVEQSRKLAELAKTVRLPKGAASRALDVLKAQAKRTAERLAPGGAALAGLLLVLVVGCVPVEAVQQARDQAAMCHGLAVEESNTREIRLFGARESLAWEAQAQALDGPIPGRETWPPIPAEFLPAQAPR